MYRARRCSTETNDGDRLQYAQLGDEPWPTGINLALAWTLMQSPLAARRPFKVLDRVGNVHGIARYTGARQGPTKGKPAMSS